MNESNQKTAGILMLVAGAGAIASALFDWYELADATTTETFKGTESSAGMGALGLGIGLLIAAAVLMTRGRRTGGKGSSVTAIVLSLLILFASGYSVASPGDAVASFEKSDISETYGISEAQAEAVVKDAVDSGALDVSAELGAIVGLVAALLGTLAGGIGVRQAKRIREESAAAPE